MREYLFNTNKIKYVTGPKPAVDCILCAIRDDDPRVSSLRVYTSENFIVSVNLYPFNPGHLMIFPKRHCVNITELSSAESVELHELSCKAIEVLEAEFHPDGFNVGYNIGSGSGASISHLHQHIVPRFDNEVGFLDVLAGARIIVVDPVEVQRRIIDKFVF